MRKNTAFKIAIAGVALLFVSILGVSISILSASEQAAPGLPQSLTRLDRGRLAAPASSSFSSSHSSDYRIAIVLPFIGAGPESIPPYLSLFCYAAGGAAGLVDFLLIHNGVLDSFHAADQCPSNVKFISLGTMEGFAERLLRVMDRPDQPVPIESRELMQRVLTKHLRTYPYALVEFKPTFGFVFQEFLQGYSHWGYSDFDILFGDLPRWITSDELQNYDIVTYGYGDQHRVYLRGQFTFHQNNDKVNQIWRGCEYLSQLDHRYTDVLTGKRKLEFESAEGCYSAVVLERHDLRVKYAVKAFTDTQEKDTVHSHGLYIGLNKKRTSSVIYKAVTPYDGRALIRPSTKWFETDSAYSDPKVALQWENGRKELVQLNEGNNAKCMYWAKAKYQSRLCINDVTENDTVFWVHGTLYKQKHVNLQLDTNVATAPLFHFQEWKRYYRDAQLTTFHHNSDFSTFVLTKEGAIPVYPKDIGGTLSPIRSPLGLSPLKWRGMKNNGRTMLPRRSYCLKSAPRKIPPSPPAPQCQQRLSWLDEDMVEILSDAPGWRKVDYSFDVTLVLTLQITVVQAKHPALLTTLVDLVVQNINHWQGQPCVLLLHVAGSSPEILSMLRSRFEVGSDIMFGTDACLIGLIAEESPDYVSRKALLNMAIDAVPTRWFISGVEIERGMQVSMNTAFFAHRQSLASEGIPGNIYMIPQFALEGIDHDISIKDLMIAEHNRMVSEPSKVEIGMCENELQPEEDVFEPMLQLWWGLTERILLDEEHGHLIEERLVDERAKTTTMFGMSLMELLKTPKQLDLFSIDQSPILLTDNVGPHSGMLTTELAREVEEFAGKKCYNGLRPAQLATLGYSFDVLAGAFAFSTEASRVAVQLGFSEEPSLGESRCDGCFMFDEEHEVILEGIAKDERTRPAKAAILWEEK